MRPVGIGLALLNEKYKYHNGAAENIEKTMK